MAKRRRRKTDTRPGEPAWRITPPVLLAGGFLVLIVLGAALLMLPVSTHDPITWGNALFTATSAVTVTGLEVVEMGPTFSFWGELVLLVLIQAGGLGLMTFAVVSMLALGGKLSNDHLLISGKTYYGTNPYDLARTARAVVKLALTLEAIALIPLAMVWVPERGWLEGLWWSLFHAVSAFNNAGIALSPHNLTDYAGNPLINLTISALYLIGGLGFAVIISLLHLPRTWQLGTNAKVMLTGTALLSLLGMAMIYTLEADNPATLGALPALSDQLWAAWLQATTPRSAGFTSLDTASLTQPTTVLLMLLMFVGAGPNGTGSGIKVTTFLVLLAATWAFIRRRQVPTLFSQAIDRDTLIKALAVGVMGILGIFMGVFTLSMTENASFLDISFEVVSAMGTVGMTRGLTTELSTLGQMMIMMTMFIGRLCPLTMAYFVGTARPPGERRGEAEIQIG